MESGEELHPFEWLDDLANFLTENGSWAIAITVYRVTLEKKKRVFGPVHDSTVMCMIRLGNTLTKALKFKDAIEVLNDALEKAREIEGEEAQCDAVATPIRLAEGALELAESKRRGWEEALRSSGDIFAGDLGSGEVQG